MSTEPLFNPWQQIAETAWWQLSLAFLAAGITVLLAYYFNERRSRREQVVLTAGKLISAARQLRRNYIGFAEYDSDVTRQQTYTAKAFANEKYEAFMFHKDVALFSQTLAADYQKEIIASQKEIDEALLDIQDICGLLIMNNSRSWLRGRVQAIAGL
jgi:hypothetical protein